MLNEIGYGHLIKSLQLRVTGCFPPARIDTRVTAVTEQDRALRIPPQVAPRSDAPIAHLEFALKYARPLPIPCYKNFPSGVDKIGCSEEDVSPQLVSV